MLAASLAFEILLNGSLGDLKALGEGVGDVAFASFVSLVSLISSVILGDVVPESDCTIA